MSRENRISIAPSILASDLSRLGEEIVAVEKAGADIIHFDIMDGHFVPNISIGFPIIESVRKVTSLPFDAHLMISEPDRFLEDFKRVGCNWLSVHIETCPHINRTLNRIKELGMKAGLAINPGSALSSLDGAMSDADFVVVMSVNPGFGGQKFLPAAYDRIREVRKKIGTSKTRIQIDGGIKKHNIGAAEAAGADIMVVGTGLFSSTNYSEMMASLRNSTSEASR
ncbi:MAG: ribulose-phosphate 3-epimerase [Deltaproteobacteria bacterium]|nr:ribulose-phosphate 3-epimerase [Deltaproteobacteria bacterium]